MISELVNFKNFVFSGDSGLSTTEIAVLFFIFCQDRKKFVFYKNVMKSALNIKDVRTLNHAIDSLIQKGLIKAARQMFRNVKGYIFSIVGIDTDCPAQNQIESRPTQTDTEPEQKDVDCNYSEPVAENIEPVDVSVSDSDSGALTVIIQNLLQKTLNLLMFQFLIQIPARARCPCLRQCLRRMFHRLTVPVFRFWNYRPAEQ